MFFKAITWAKNPRPNKCRDTADHVDDSAAGKVLETSGHEPATTPDPVSDDWINEAGVDDSADYE